MSEHQPEKPQTGTDTKPAAPTEWRSPTMLSPEEIEDLRQESQRDSEWMRAKLAEMRRARQASDR
jgi:hypothetical protein